MSAFGLELAAIETRLVAAHAAAEIVLPGILLQRADRNRRPWTPDKANSYLRARKLPVSSRRHALGHGFDDHVRLLSIDILIGGGAVGDDDVDPIYEAMLPYFQTDSTDVGVPVDLLDFEEAPSLDIGIPDPSEARRSHFLSLVKIPYDFTATRQ